jgi:hypothetical protein
MAEVMSSDVWVESVHQKVEVPPPLCAAFQHPDKATAIHQHRSRFAATTQPNASHSVVNLLPD